MSAFTHRDRNSSYTHTAQGNIRCEMYVFAHHIDLIQADIQIQILSGKYSIMRHRCYKNIVSIKLDKKTNKLNFIFFLVFFIIKLSKTVKTVK